MKDAKILLLIKNVDIELAQKIQKLVNEYNAAKALEVIGKHEKGN